MSVVLTSEVGGLAVGATYTGPLEPFYLAEGYARAVSSPVDHTMQRGVAVIDDPTLNINREAPGQPFKLSGSLAAPEVATVTRVSGAADGAVGGGTVVEIAGDNLRDVTAVTFGGTAGTALSIVSDQAIRVTTPAHAAGAVNVVVTDPDGSATKTNGYTYA